MTEHNEVSGVLNELLGVYWGGYAQHQTHVTLLESLGIAGLAASMHQRIADEPRTIRPLLNLLLDLDGTPSFTIAEPNIGTTLRELLDNDMTAQRLARPGLNTEPRERPRT